MSAAASRPSQRPTGIGDSASSRSSPSATASRNSSSRSSGAHTRAPPPADTAWAAGGSAAGQPAKALGVLGEGERDAPARLGAGLRRGDDGRDALARDQVERELGGEAPGGDRGGDPSEVVRGQGGEDRHRGRERDGDAPDALGGRLLGDDRRGRRFPDPGEILEDRARPVAGVIGGPQEEPRAPAGAWQNDEVRSRAGQKVFATVWMV